MGKTKTKSYGKPVANHNGYTIRMMVTPKTNEKTKKTVFNHSGKFCVVAGKKLLKEVASVADGMKEIERLSSK